MKQFHFLIILLIMLMAGCVHQSALNRQNIENILVGQDEADLIKVMGPPNFILTLQDKKVVYYYQVETKEIREALNQENCIPVLIENKKVVSIGPDFAANWCLGLVPHKRAADKTAVADETALKKADEERLQKIKALEESVRPVPVTNYALNLKLYRKLLQLDSENERYQEKVALYQSKMENEKPTFEDQEQGEGTIDGSEKIGFEEVCITDADMQLYRGNDMIELALRELSNGNLYVWVKNIGPVTINLEADNYKLFDKNKNTIDCHPGSGLIKKLPAGQIAHGQLKYTKQDAVQLGKIVLEHAIAGKITRVFP